VKSAERIERIEILRKQATLIKKAGLSSAEQIQDYRDTLVEIERLQRIEAGFQDIMVYAQTYFTGEPPHDLLKADTPSPKFHYELTKTLRETALAPTEQRVVTAAPRSHAKCLSGDSIVYTKSGRKKLIDIGVGDEVLSMGHDLKMTFNRVTNKWNSGVKDIYEVTTKSGHKIKTTLDHKFYTFDGYKRLKDIKIGEVTAVTRKLTNEASLKRSVEEVRFLSYMIAEGSLSSGNCSFTNADVSIVDDFTKCATALGFNVAYSGRYGYKLSGGARAYLRNEGLYGHTAKTKRLPEWIFDLSPELKAEFISAMWDTDGYISQQAQSIGITLANEGLINDIRELLLSLGIQSRKIPRIQTCNGKEFPAFTLHISDRENILRFSECIKLTLKQQKLVEISQAALERKPHPTNDAIPSAWRKHLSKTPHYYRTKHGVRVDNKYSTSREKLQTLVSLGHENEYLTNLASSDLFWDEIVSIDYVGPEVTYDIEVEDTHNFVANSFVVHNSTIVTNIFPLWCICYVEDVGERYWVIIGDKQDNARKFLDVIKSELEDNDLLKADFGSLKGSTWNSLEIITNNNVKLSAHGAGEGLRGLRYGSFRPSLICDDLESDESCSTPDRIAKMIDWFDRTVLPLGDPKKSKYYLIGTVIHYNSLLSQVINHRSDWTAYKFRAIEEFPKRMDLWNRWEEIFHSRDEGNNPMEASRIARQKAMAFYDENVDEMNNGARVLWPERLDLLRLMELRAVKRLAFNSEYQNSPIDEDTRVFHKLWYYEPEDVSLDELEIFGACDPSMGQSRRSDPSVIFTLGRHRKTGVFYVLDVDEKRRHPDQIIQDIFRKARHFNYASFVIETVAFQQFMKDEIAKRSAEQGVYLPLREFKSTVKKEIRITATEPMYTSGYIRLLPTQRDYIEQLEYFPKASHDDILDAASMAIELAKKRSGTFTFGRI
jgi:predicted phage terminase large subunit-like protein